MRSSEGTIIDDIFKSELSLVMSTEMWVSPHETRRKEGVYADVMIVSAFADYVWYRDLVGMTFFCRLVFFKHPYKKMDELYSVHPVKLTKTKMFQGRSFHISDIAIM